MWTSPWETYYISTHLPLCNVTGASPANELKIPAHVLYPRSASTWCNERE